jgi:hypothetical protein
MAEIVNLRRARKNKARAEEKAEADANRRKHGVPLSERRLSRARNEKLQHDLEAGRLSDPEE